MHAVVILVNVFVGSTLNQHGIVALCLPHIHISPSNGGHTMVLSLPCSDYLHYVLHTNSLLSDNEKPHTMRYITIEVKRPHH